MRLSVLVTTAVGSLVIGEAAMAQTRGCPVVEVAPGVKMRSDACSNPFDSRIVRERREAVPTPGRPAAMRYDGSEVRMGGSVRYEWHGQRR